MHTIKGMFEDSFEVRSVLWALWLVLARNLAAGCVTKLVGGCGTRCCNALIRADYAVVRCTQCVLLGS